MGLQELAPQAPVSQVVKKIQRYFQRYDGQTDTRNTLYKQRLNVLKTHDCQLQPISF
jgi:hypothetical protein